MLVFSAAAFPASPIIFSADDHDDDDDDDGDGDDGDDGDNSGGDDDNDDYFRQCPDP